MIRQFLRDVDWGDVDYLIIDTPPGTSDEHLSVVQYLAAAHIDGAVILTTPQVSGHHPHGHAPQSLVVYPWCQGRPLDCTCGCGITALRTLPGGGPPGCPEGDQLLPQGEAAHHRCGGEHEWLHLPQVQGKGWFSQGCFCFPCCVERVGSLSSPLLWPEYRRLGVSYPK